MFLQKFCSRLKMGLKMYRWLKKMGITLDNLIMFRRILHRTRRPYINQIDVTKCLNSDIEEGNENCGESQEY